MLSPRRSAQLGLGGVILVLAACVVVLLNGAGREALSAPSILESTSDAMPASAEMRAC